MPDLPWDPKWPGNQPEWEDEYDRARPDVSDPDSDWGRIFAEIVTADKAGSFKYLRSLHDDSKAAGWETTIWRWALWEVFCKPIFDGADTAAWPKYAKDAYDAISPTWPLASIGRREGIPPDWFQEPTANPRKVVAFKATVLLIAGLIENVLLPTPDEVARFIMKFMEDNVSDTLKQEMYAVTGELRKRYVFAR